ncbi:hypothetical protein R6V09_40660, partial [Streptomyces sp. W16]|nr:hypothetical protein [Streptomyces sp. W16]
MPDRTDHGNPGNSNTPGNPGNSNTPGNPGNLPPETRSFVGRRAELARLRAALDPGLDAAPGAGPA